MHACSYQIRQVCNLLAQKVGAYGPCISVKCYLNCNTFLECFYYKLGCIHLLKLAVRKLESKMNKHADRVTGEGFVTMRAPKQCEKNLVKNRVKGEMKAEWKK